MNKRRFWSFFLAVALPSCQRTRVIANKPIKLGKTPVRIAMDGGKSSGPTRELCLRMSQEDVDSIEKAFEGTRKRQSPIHVVLLTVRGVPDTLDAQLLRRDAMTLCLWDHGLGIPTLPHSIHSGATSTVGDLPPRTAQYTAVELSSDRPIRVSEVRWWSGQRTGVP